MNGISGWMEFVRFGNRLFFLFFFFFFFFGSHPLCGVCLNKKSKGERNQKGYISLGAQFAFFLFHSPPLSSWICLLGRFQPEETGQRTLLAFFKDEEESQSFDAGRSTWLCPSRCCRTHKLGGLVQQSEATRCWFLPSRAHNCKYQQQSPSNWGENTSLCQISLPIMIPFHSLSPHPYSFLFQASPGTYKLRSPGERGPCVLHIQLHWPDSGGCRPSAHRDCQPLL